MENATSPATDEDDNQARLELANAVRALAMDAVQAANSGHPGAPMGMADIAEVLWNDFLRFNPTNPHWANRDRFVLSNGHASMLLYAVLHLSGYDLPIEELQRFRQLHSHTPGHPEYGDTPGVETTTGPLGQGLANAVGMAIAERTLAAQFNRNDFDVVDHHTYVALGDGCLMEGISHEACSLAGTMGLGKLIALYDDNGISIDGEVSGWFADDTPLRFEAYGWQVIRNVDGHNPQEVIAALKEALADRQRPSMLCCKTTIGWGSPNKAGSAECHGAALGAEEIANTRRQIGWPHAPFEIPQHVSAAWDGHERGAHIEAEWNAKFEQYRTSHPALATEFERRNSGALAADSLAAISAAMHKAQQEPRKLATRQASKTMLDALGPVTPELLGGSADLTGSVGTLWSGATRLDAQNPDGNYLYYGVREFAMSAIMNGLALHGGFLPYAGTFLVFSDYARNALRLAALMGLRGIFVYTHDSIGLGEDGPTHQAVEHTSSLRLMPNMSVWRPCDEVETAAAWHAAITRDSGPTSLVLTRQGLEPQPRDAQTLTDVGRGGYVLVDPNGPAEAIIIATGSEVALAVGAANRLNDDGRKVRVVSMPSTDTFDAQEAEYRARVLPPSITRRLAIEAATPDYWHKYVGITGKIIGMPGYGASAPAGELFKHFGFTEENVIAALQALFD
jgi:transketolase